MEKEGEYQEKETHLFAVGIEESVQVDYIRMGYHSHDLQFSILLRGPSTKTISRDFPSASINSRRKGRGESVCNPP